MVSIAPRPVPSRNARKALKLSLLMLQGSRIKLRAACRAPPGIWQRSCRTFWTDTRSFHHSFPAIDAKLCAQLQWLMTSVTVSLGSRNHAKFGLLLGYLALTL